MCDSVHYSAMRNHVSTLHPTSLRTVLSSAARYRFFRDGSAYGLGFAGGYHCSALSKQSSRCVRYQGTAAGVKGKVGSKRIPARNAPEKHPVNRFREDKTAGDTTPYLASERTSWVSRIVLRDVSASLNGMRVIFPSYRFLVPP